MNERLALARQLGEQIDARWQRADVEAQLARLQARQRTQARRRAIAAPLAAAALTAAVFLAMSAARETPPRPAVPSVRDVTVERLPHEWATAPLMTPMTPPAASATERPPRASMVPPTGDGRIVRDVARVDPGEPAQAPEPSATWRDEAARGDYTAAWGAFARSSDLLDRMEDLLLAGDVARLSGHADAAVVQLMRAVALFPQDPRAPLAAFTLGRVHLENLGAPREAAQAFAHARELAPAGPLAEDALAREVEAWSRAGETETARTQALTYTQRYPQGRRVHAVRRFGGLEGP
jgi:transmembrane sensor